MTILTLISIAIFLALAWHFHRRAVVKAYNDGWDAAVETAATQDDYEL